MITESIKEGFLVAHKNWQVILLRLASGIINLIGFFIFIGIPLLIAIVSFGMDLAQIKDMVPGLLENPVEILSRYFALAALLLAAFVIYLTIASIIIIYVFGGMLGVLKNAVFDADYRFTFSSFFHEAGKSFFPLLWLFSLAFLIICLIALAVILLAAVIFALIQAYGGTGTAVSVFIGYFMAMLVILLFVTSVLGSLIYTTYASIAMVADNKGVMDSFRKAWDFIINKPMALVFYLILISGILAVNLVLIVIGLGFQMMPLIGLFTSIPYQLAYYGVQLYLSVVMWGSLVSYYIRNAGRPVAAVIHSDANDI